MNTVYGKELDVFFGKPIAGRRVYVAQTTIYVMTGFFGILLLSNSFLNLDHFPSTSSIVFRLEVWVCSLAVFLAFMLWSRYQWFELDGDVLRGKRILTRAMKEWLLSDIVSVEPHVGLLRFKFIRKELKMSDFGYVLGFKVGKRLLLNRSEIKGLDEFVAALKEQVTNNRV